MYVINVSPLQPLSNPTGIIALADVDPLGVNQNVTFDEVGGLDDRESDPQRTPGFLCSLSSRYQCPQGDDTFASPVS